MSAKCRSSVGRVSIDHRSSICRVSGRCIDQSSVYRRRQLTAIVTGVCRQCIGEPFRSSIGNVSVAYRSSIGTACSTLTDDRELTDISVDTPDKTQDPASAVFWFPNKELGNGGH